MASSLKRSYATTDIAAILPARIKRMEQFENTNSTYWSANSAFDSKRVLLRRLLFINEDRTKYISVGFYPAGFYLALLKFGVKRRGGWPKKIILTNKRVNALAEGLRKLCDALCSGGEPAGGSECKSVAFRLNVTRSRRTARLYSDSVYFTDSTRHCLSLVKV